MPEPTQTDVAAAEFRTPEAPATEEALVEESLVEEVSIDGMCGVY
ncbi:MULTISPECIES: mycofactocin precursor MftA [unclassified Blastococcus]